jgi:hypothetical protein
MTMHFHVGHNLAGYMPESDVSCHTDYAEAVADLVAEMRDYANSDDEGTLAYLEDLARSYPNDYPRAEQGDFGDDTPSMLATVESILADDGPSATPAEYSAHVTDGMDRTIVFWLSMAPAADCEEHESSY